MSPKPVLRAEEHERFIRDGYCVFKRAVPPRTIAAAVRVLEAGALPDANAPVRRHADIPEVAACLTEKVYRAVGELMGADYPYDRHRRLVDKARPLERGRAWDLPLSHTDNDYPTVMPDVWAVGFFIFLTRVKSRGGAFVYYPGSALRYRRLLARTPGCLRVRDGVVEETGPWEEFLAEPGDVMLFHHLLGHSASANVACRTTRHALLGHFGPTPRLVPGSKPFSRMSTLEKANSARYLASRGWADPVPPPPPAPAAFGEDLLFCEVARRADETLCFFVEKARPGELRLARTRDWSSWTAEREPVLSGAPLRSVALAALGRDCYLFTGTEAGAEVRRGGGLPAWTKTCDLPGMRAPAGHVDIVSPAAMRRGYCMLFWLRDGAVVSRRGQDWARASEWDGEARVAAAPGALEVRVHPIWGENLLALVLETEKGLVYRLCEDGERFDGEPRPLKGPAGMRQLRVYARARRYWLVAYLQGGRLGWGEVDWEAAPGVVKPLRGAEAFGRALETVGLR